MRKRYAARPSPKQSTKLCTREGHQPSTHHRWSSATGACPLFSSRPDLVLMFDESPVRQLIQFSGLECFRPAPQLGLACFSACFRVRCWWAAEWAMRQPFSSWRAPNRADPHPANGLQWIRWRCASLLFFRFVRGYRALCFVSVLTALGSQGLKLVKLLAVLLFHQEGNDARKQFRQRDYSS